MLRRFFRRRSLRRQRPGYRSRFGGLWTDRVDASELLAARVAEGAISAEEAGQLRFWMENGFVVLPGAVPHEVVDEVNREIEGVWERRDERFQIEIGAVYHDVDPELRSERYKLLDLHVHSRAALRAAFAPAIRSFLSLAFDRDILLFQGLAFEWGSGQPVHQDSAYVVVSSPLELAASWVALEDIRPGSGELHYYPGSQRLPEHLFRGGYRNWNKERDGDAAHFAWLDSLHTKADAMGLELTTFLPKKGDAVIWSADLAHGGSEITDTSLTRKSLVCHYCPKGVEPYYWTYLPARRAVRSFEPGCFYTSSYYALD